ncbi:MAG: hypothetical protein AB7I19_13790 [Planctomycetota bacterium]
MTPFRDVFGSFLRAALSLRTWPLVWLVLTLLALPAALAAGDVVGHDGARWPSLTRMPPDGDVFAALRLDLVLPLILALLFGVLVAGGVSGAVALPGTATRVREILATGARAFFANLRVMLVFVVLALLLGWGLDQVDHWLIEDRIGDRAVSDDAFSLWRLHVSFVQVLWLWDILRGFLFLLLVFASKVAIARISRGASRSAFAAAMHGLFCVVRHPWRVPVAVLLWTVVWLGGAFAFGELTVRVLEVHGNLLLGLALSQLGIAFAVIGWIGFVLSAREVGVPARDVALPELD